MRTCIVHAIMVSYPQLASLATYKFDSAIFRLNFGNSLYNVHVVFISEHGVSVFGFFFLAHVAEEFSEVARDTRILHWRDHYALHTKKCAQFLHTVWSLVLGRAQLLSMFHCFALIVNSLINWKLKLYRYSINIRTLVSKTQCMQFQPPARIQILEYSPRKCGLSITILNSEAAFQGGQFKKASLSPVFIAT